MNMLKIPHNALVFVGNGRKALAKCAKFPDLKAENVFEEENPSTHEQGSDRPGRVSEAVLSGRRSAVKPQLNIPIRARLEFDLAQEVGAKTWM